MSGSASLGEAQVAIRATLDKLDGDLNSAKSRIGQVMGGIGKGLGTIGKVGFGAFTATAGTAVTAIAGVGIALGNMAKNAAQIEGLQNAFESLSGQAGTTGDDMLAALQKGSGGTVAARDLMESFNKAASLVSLEFATDLPSAMELVSKAAAATGQDMGFLMDSLVTGVGRVSPMILDNLGIQVSLTEATEKYAEANGLVASELTKTEQQAAVQALTMEKLNEKYGAMESVYDTAGSKMQQMQASFQNAKDEMGMAFMPVLTSLADALTGLANDLLPAIIPLVETFASGFLLVLEALSPLLPIITTFADKIAIVFDSLMGGDIGVATAVFSSAMEGLTESLSEILPDLITFGIDILFAIVEGILAALPILIETASTLLTPFLESIVSEIPNILSLGIDLILTLVDGITQSLPEIIPLAAEAVINFVGGVIEKLPDIISAGIELLLALVEGILAALPELVAAIPELIIALIDAIISNLPQILEAGVEIIVALVGGLIQAIPELIAAVPEIIGALIDAFKGIWPQIKEIGQNIIDGIKEGISNAWKAFKEWVSNLFPDLPQWVKKLLGIGSPSKVFAEIGKELNAGLALGINVSADMPKKELRDLSMDLIPEAGNLSLLNRVSLGASNLAGGERSPTTNYNLTANYKYQDEMTLTEQIRLLELLGSTI